ncbi:MAG: OmpA family protein [Deltaproteobacteria bacterium]|nr:OmpA family protein [Deltaproteobacteria bacterium]
MNKARILSFVVGFALPIFLFQISSFSQVFQQSNTSCEYHLVLCDSVAGSGLTCSGGSESSAHSVACKNSSTFADFNGDGFPDCVALRAGEQGNAAFSILLGNGPGNDCGGLTEQFDSNVLNYTPNPINTVGSMGSVSVGRFSATPDLTSIFFPQYSDYEITIFSNPDASGGYGLDGSTVTPSHLSWLPKYGVASPTVAQPTSAVFECAGSDVAGNKVVPLIDQSSPSNLILAVFDASGTRTDVDTGVLADTTASASIAVGDLNNDQNKDVAIALNDSVNGSKIILCDFTGKCPSSMTYFCDYYDVGSGASNPRPTSIAIGDFNGDGWGDIVYTTPGLTATPGAGQEGRGIHYLINGQNGGFNLSNYRVYAPTTTGEPFALTTGCFNNDNAEDVAFTYQDDTNNVSSGRVVVFNSAFSSGAYAPSNTALPLSFGAGKFLEATGISSSNFDLAGGDDLIALATAPSLERKAFVFMNSLESIVSNAGSDISTLVGVATVVSGECSTNPADASAIFSASWSVAVVTGDSNYTSSGTSTLVPTFTFNTPGTYDLTLTCSSRCGKVPSDFAHDTKRVTVLSKASTPNPGGGNQNVNNCGNNVCDLGESCDGTACGPVPSGYTCVNCQLVQDTGGGNTSNIDGGSNNNNGNSNSGNQNNSGNGQGQTGAQVVGGQTTLTDSQGNPLDNQGGCVASLNPAVNSNKTPVFFYVGLVAFLVALRFRRSSALKGVFSLSLILLSLMLFNPPAKADPSFGLNFFKPAMDDSEYYSVYGSPTLQQGKFHFGLWFDYARRPYEVGNSNFVRQSGISDNVLIADALASYGVLNWLDVGIRMPVYLWESINAPALGRLDEAHTEMGDLEFALKFKILDRKKHHVGVSLLPYLSIPSATNAATNFTGNGDFSGGGKLIVDFKPHKRVSVAANVGYEMRSPVLDVAGHLIDDQFQGGLGVSVDALPKKLKVIAEAEVKTVKFFEDRRTSPLEARLGGRYSFKNGIDVNFGGGMGMTNGITAPAYRAFTGVTYTKRPPDELEIKNTGDELPLKDDQDVYLVGDEIRMAEKLFFDYDKFNIREISKPILGKVAAFLNKHVELKRVRVEGHTCDLGSDRYNQKLSQNRAQSVVDHLVGQGVDAGRLRAVGYGKAKPIVPNSDESHREQNRRVQLFVEERN